MPICKPEIFHIEEKKFEVQNLYNPLTALYYSREQTVLNDMKFDESGRIFILTGPNQGGKSVFTYGIGIIQSLFQLGLFIPAKSARLSPGDFICIHFPEGQDTNSNKGKFGEECARVKGIFQKISPYSLVLMDETFSSTSAVEGSYIASQVLMAMSKIGARCIFATHFHDLAQKANELNKEVNNDKASKIDTLTAKMKIDSSQRSYKILRAKPEGLSYAKDIAKRYGLILSELVPDNLSN